MLYVPGGDLPGVKTIKLDKLASFLELEREGLTPFSLGPVYVYAGVQEDLVGRFAIEKTGRATGHYTFEDRGIVPHDYTLDPRAAILAFEFPVVGRCMDWNQMLYVMDSVSYEHFKTWMLAQQFVNRVENKFFLPRVYSAPVIDPLARAYSGVAVPTKLDVISLAGMKGTLVPAVQQADKAQVPFAVDLKLIPPEEEVVTQGALALKLIREV